MLLLCAAFSCAKAAGQPLTTSFSMRTEEGIVVRGERAMIDFEWLKRINADVRAWIYQEETRLSKPILQSGVDHYYAKRGFDGCTVNQKGMAYLRADASAAMNESTVYVYGSGREGGSLESLNRYQEPDYASAHPSFRLLTPAGDLQLDVFASVKTMERSREGWLPGQEGESFQEWLTRVIEQSEFCPANARLPEPTERILVFTVQNAGTNRRLIFTAMRPIRYETSRNVDLNKAEMDGTATQSGYAQVGPLGQWMVYAQNDSLWGQMRYESARTSRYRHFDGGGCGPTAVAMVIANLVDTEQLPRLAAYSANGQGTLFCPCSVNRLFCNHLHPPYHLETAQEYLRYLPVIMADFAAGNNRWGINSRPTNSLGSNMAFLEPLREIYGLRQTAVSNLVSGLEEMKTRKAGESVLLCCALRGSPFTSSSHYVVVAGLDGRYFYVLDPLFRSDYSSTDRRSYIDQILAPGVVRIKLENARKCGLSVVGLIEKAEGE